jgi:hypothetical protein
MLTGFFDRNHILPKNGKSFSSNEPPPIAMPAYLLSLNDDFFYMKYNLIVRHF